MTATFNLGDELEPLGYDFTTGPGGWDEKRDGPGKGPIPEPTHASVRRFRETLREAAGVAPDATEEAYNAAVIAMGTRDQRLSDGLITALSELCQGSPSAKELAALGTRAQRAFLRFILGKLAEPMPTKPASGTSERLVLVQDT